MDAFPWNRGKTVLRDIGAARRFAESRHGILTLDDLLRFGISPQRISRLVATGVIARLHRTVYRLSGAAATIEQRALAACLACGDLAVVSHASGLEVWGLVTFSPERPIDVTLPAQRRAAHRGIQAHRSTTLASRTTTMRGRIPITRVARTLQDAAPQIGPVLVERALDEALRTRTTEPNALLEELAAGRGALRRLALDRLGHGIPESELERNAIRLLRKFGLPEPVRQYEVQIAGRRYRLDLAYPDHHVAIELMGRAPHWGRERWQADSDRRYRLDRAGWNVVELTNDAVVDHAAESAFKVADALGLVPTRWRSAAR